MTDGGSVRYARAEGNDNVGRYKGQEKKLDITENIILIILVGVVLVKNTLAGWDA